MFQFLRDVFYREPKWSDPKTHRWATLYQKRARFYGVLPEASVMDQLGLGAEDRFWRQDNRKPADGFAVNFDVPLFPYLEGTEDSLCAGLAGSDDFGKEVKSFPLHLTGKRVSYDCMDRMIDVPFESDSVSVKGMVEIVCGILARRVLPKRDQYEISEELDFGKARLRRIVWDPNDQVWCVLFRYE